MRTTTPTLLCTALLGLVTHATWGQSAGIFTLDGWPTERLGYFAGTTHIVVDGDRMKVVEWPGNSEDKDQTMETYYLPTGLVKVFSWNDERIGLVFESEGPLPRAEVNSEGQWVLPPPFPPRVSQESQIPCGEGCVYWVRNASFQPLDPAAFGPGGDFEGTFAPPADIPLLTTEEFVDRFRMEVPDVLPRGAGFSE
jgi:hypothetical protein